MAVSMRKLGRKGIYSSLSSFTRSYRSLKELSEMMAFKPRYLAA
jgi:hypothetical protein